MKLSRFISLIYDGRCVINKVQQRKKNCSFELQNQSFKKWMFHTTAQAACGSKRSHTQMAKAKKKKKLGPVAGRMTPLTPHYTPFHHLV